MPPEDRTGRAGGRFKHAYYRAIATDPTAARYAKNVSPGIASVIFVQQEISKDANGDSTFSLPMILSYTPSYFKSIGNEFSSSGYRTVMRIFKASMGYIKLRIQHSFPLGKYGKQSVSATAELCVLDMTIGDEIEGYSTEIEGNDNKRPPVTTAYSELGINLAKKDLEGIDMNDVAAYKTTLTMKDTRHAAIHHVIEEMARDKIEGFREIVDVVTSVFSQRRKLLKMTVFVPGFDQQYLRALETLKEDIRRSAMSPYLPLCIKVPDTEKFSYPSQMVSHEELTEHTQQESPEVYYQTILERLELDSSTMEYLLHESGNEVKETKSRAIPGAKYSIAWHIRNIVKSVRQGTMTVPVAMDISDLMAARQRDPSKVCE